MPPATRDRNDPDFTIQPGVAYSLVMARKKPQISRSKVRYAPLKVVDEYTAQASGQVITCRDKRHDWKLYDIQGGDDEGFIRYYRCACKAMLEQTLDADGIIVARRMKYPKGYQMPAGTGRLSREGLGLIRLASARADLRTMMMRRKAAGKAS